MLSRGIQKGVATVLTQVEVDANDPAFSKPTKPIGAFMSREEAQALVKERNYTVVEDAGRGYRRVVASPARSPSWKSSPFRIWWTPAWWSSPAAAGASLCSAPRGSI